MTARHSLLWVVWDIHTPQATGSALKIQFFVFWDLIMTNLHDFPYLVNRRLYKVGWLLRMNTRMDLWFMNGCSKICTLLRQLDVPFWGALSYEISKVSISRELYIILNWLAFQNNQKSHLFVSVWRNIWIKDQIKWAKMRISGLI